MTLLQCQELRYFEVVMADGHKLVAKCIVNVPREGETMEEFVTHTDSPLWQAMHVYRQGGAESLSGEFFVFGPGCRMREISK